MAPNPYDSGVREETRNICGFDAEMQAGWWARIPMSVCQRRRPLGFCVAVSQRGGLVTRQGRFRSERRREGLLIYKLRQSRVTHHHQTSLLPSPNGAMMAIVLLLLSCPSHTEVSCHFWAHAFAHSVTAMRSSGGGGGGGEQGSSHCSTVSVQRELQLCSVCQTQTSRKLGQ